MEVISRPFNGKNYWKKKGYKLLDGSTTRRRNHQTVKMSGSNDQRRRFWRLKKAPKLRFMKTIVSASPKKLWNTIKDGYVSMMLWLAGNVGPPLNGGNVFEAKRINSTARNGPTKYSKDDFESRLVLEIYKALSASRGLYEVV